MAERPTLLGVDDALTGILDGVAPLDVETVTLHDAHRRTLRELVTATLAQPPFAASSMDGYAVCARDVASVPTRLRVVGEAAAGHPFDSQLTPGEAVRIFTGAPLPDGTDAIVIQEDVTRDGDTISVAAAIEPGTYVRPAGGDFKSGTTLFAPGHVLTSRDLMLMAANGLTDACVGKRPRIGILATGDEIVSPGAPRREGQIFSSVPAGLCALVETFGGTPVPLGIAPDDPAALSEHLRRADDCDVLVTIGGASVGDHDLVHGALGELGVDLAFWKIAMRPGKPLMYGRRTIGTHTQHVLGLPGNPVSGMVCGRIFLVPLMRGLLGTPGVNSTDDLVSMPLAAPLPQNGVRRHYMRARYVMHDGQRTVEPVESQDSSLMRLLAEADCLIVRRRGEKAASTGERVDVLPLDF